MAFWEKVYLGDGLYAIFDGYQFKVTAEDGYCATNTVYFDRQVLATFIKYTQNILGDSK